MTPVSNIETIDIKIHNINVHTSQEIRLCEENPNKIKISGDDDIDNAVFDRLFEDILELFPSVKDLKSCVLNPSDDKSLSLITPENTLSNRAGFFKATFDFETGPIILILRDNI